MEGSKVSNFFPDSVQVVILMRYRVCQKVFSDDRPPALWPIADKSALEILLTSLSEQNLKDIIIVVCNYDKQFGDDNLQAILDKFPELNITVQAEQFPAGSAGAIRGAFGDTSKKYLLLLGSAMINLPSVQELFNAHVNSNSEITVFLNPSADDGQDDIPQPAEIYFCNAGVSQFIPPDGYFDLKEGLIPRLIRAGKNIHAANLAEHACNFGNINQYIYAVGSFISKPHLVRRYFPRLKENTRKGIWCGSSAKISPSAKLIPPVIVLDNALIGDDAVVSGPAIIGKNVKLMPASVVKASVIWDDSVIQYGAGLSCSIVDSRSVVKAEKRIRNTFYSKPINPVISAIEGFVLSLLHRVDALVPHFKFIRGIAERCPKPLKPLFNNFPMVLAFMIVIAAFFFSHWYALKDTWTLWLKSDEYSAGIIVPFLAIYILWSRRNEFKTVVPHPSILVGGAVFLFAEFVRFFGTFFGYGSLERFSVVFSVWAIVILIFGVPVFKKALSVLLFLILMMPWPNQVQAAVTLPLQKWATSSAVFSLELLGYDVAQDGNIIQIGDTSVAIAEACNGLRMVTAFVIVTGLVVLVVNKKLWQKIIVFVSCIPIALLCNTIRLTVTAVAFTFIDAQKWEMVFHDFGGYAMMPLALGFSMLELWFLEKLTTPPSEHKLTPDIVKSSS